MKHFLIALQFLTIFPIKIKSRIEEKDFGSTLLYFPIVGMVIGLVLVSVWYILGFLPTLVKVSCILIMEIIITGGIHLDGFGDTCDGFYGHKHREEILEIMRDSRVGVMGVVGIVCMLLLKFTLIVGLPQDILWKGLIMMPVFGRWSQVWALFGAKYVREQGKAKYFIEYGSRKGFIMATFFTIVLFIVLMRMKGILLLVLSIVPIFLFIRYVKKRIGGMTGDTIGAVSEIGEIAILFLALCLY